MAGRGRRMRPVDWLLRNAGGKRGWRRGGSTIARTPTTLVVSPASFTVTDTFTAQLNATVLDQFGQTMSGESVTWASDNTAVATVSQTGLVTGEDVGTCTITAVVVGYPTATDDSACTVQAKTATVTVAPASFTIEANQQQALLATPRDSQGNALTGRAILWVSTDTNVLTVAAGSGYNATATGVGEGSAQAQATVEGVVGSATGNVSVPSGGAVYANEPAGFTLVARMLCDTLPTNPSSKPTGWTNSWGRTDATNLAIISDPTAPVNGPNVLRIRFPNGFDDGSAPCNIFTDWSTGSLPEDIGEMSEQFLAYTFKWYGNGSNYEQQAAGTKFGFWSGPDINTNGNEFFLLTQGVGGKAFLTDLGLRVDLQGGGGLTHVWQRNVGSGNPIVVGQWQTLEVYQRTNDIGSANGILKVWVGGTLIMNYSDAVFRNTTYPQKFRSFKMNPTWGGNSGELRTRDDDVYLADIYISGKL